MKKPLCKAGVVRDKIEDMYLNRCISSLFL